MSKCNIENKNNINVGQSILIASNLLKRKLDHQIVSLTNEEKITGANSYIIGFLVSNQKKEIFQKTIEKEFSLKPSTVSANLRLLEQKGYITREYSKIDTRKKFVKPTEKAIQLNEKICERGYEVEEDFKKILNKDEQVQLIGLLTKVIETMEKEER